MISIDQAQAILQKYAYTLALGRKNNTEQINIAGHDSSNAIGRIIAENIYSPIDVPEFDNSAMDGYAYNSTDVALNTPIPIVGESAAGNRPTTLQYGTCMRIFTGATIPKNADTVVPQEQCKLDEPAHTIQIVAPLPPQGMHIRPRKQNFAKGDLIFTKGDLLSITGLTMLASLGITEISIVKKLAVAICITGDELKPSGTTLEPGQIYESNGVFLKYTLESIGCEIVFCKQIGDDHESTRDTLHQLAQNSDLIVCSGGVSVGDKDYIQKVLLHEGNVFIRKVSIKPGKPFTFVELDHTPVLALPGNPLSVFITCLWFVVPFVKTIQKSSSEKTHTSIVAPHIRLHTIFSPQHYYIYPRTRFIFTTLDFSTMKASPLPDQSSAVLKNMILGDGAMIIPANTEIALGDSISFFEFK